MKKCIALLLCVLMTAFALSCSDSQPDEGFIDLTALSDTIAFARINDIFSNPDKYEGKTIKIRGNFTVYKKEATGNVYYACVISDATACCARGFEFVPKNECSYPDDFPEKNSIITVSGVFNTYIENENKYCQLLEAEFE